MTAQQLAALTGGQIAPGVTHEPQGGSTDLESSLMAYFNSDPAFQSEYQRHMSQANGTDARTPAEWMYDHIQSSPQDQQKFSVSVGIQAGGETIPLEQGLLDATLPGILADIEGDAGRRSLVSTLTGQATEDYNAARNALSPEENAARLQAEYAMADTTAGRLSDSAGTAATEQLAALQAAIAAMQQNLTGESAARAAALQEQIAAFTANLDTFDATQKAALAEQITANQANLEASIAAQQQALATEIASLQGAADAQSVARRAALQAEIDGLTAAQAPMAQARLDSANALSSAVNMGLESTLDQMTAQRAKQGYLGSSSFDRAAQTRATIGARQGAAQALGGARELNAADTRAIAGRGATEGRLISDELANNYLTIAGRGATGGRSLADILAEGTRTIGDTGAAGTAAIKVGTGAARQNIGNAGATQTYQDRTVAANDLQALLDALAQGKASIAGNRSVQQQDARNQGTMARQGYFDNAYTRGQGAILSRPGLSTNLASTLTSLGNYGNSGTNRSLGLLNWWNTGGQQAPVADATDALIDQSGNAIAGLGGDLLSGALKAGSANNWWQKPAATTTKPSSSFGTYGDSPYW